MGYRQTHADAGLGSISGVVSSLPAGYTLGEERVENDIKYQLVYNAGNSEIGPGYLCISTTTVGNLYSVTVSSVTESVAGIRGANLHSTAATGTYFWMVRSGHPVKLVASNISIATGTRVGPAANGKVITTDTAANYIGVNVGDAASATATTDAAGSRFHVWFDGLTASSIYA